MSADVLHSSDKNQTNCYYALNKEMTAIQTVSAVPTLPIYEQVPETQYEC